MAVSQTHYDLWARLFEYPDSGWVAAIDAACTALATAHPAAQAELVAFRGGLQPAGDLHAMQELYTRSFDVQGLTTLDIGYVLFGDDYKRGELLSHLSREHRDANNDCGTELGDHLPNLLRLLPRMRDEELARELVEELIAPAVRRMIDEFDPERITRKDALYQKHHKTLIDAATPNQRTVYRSALGALYALLERDFALTATPLTAPLTAPRVKQTPDFAAALSAELQLENDGVRAA